MKSKPILLKNQHRTSKLQSFYTLVGCKIMQRHVKICFSSDDCICQNYSQFFKICIIWRSLIIALKTISQFWTPWTCEIMLKVCILIFQLTSYHVCMYFSSCFFQQPTSSRTRAEHQRWFVAKKMKTKQLPLANAMADTPSCLR